MVYKINTRPSFNYLIMWVFWKLNLLNRNNFSAYRTYDLVAKRRILLCCLFIFFGVMLPYPLFAWLYVLLRIEARWREIWRPTWWSTRNLKSQASCAHDHFSLPNNVPVNQCDMLRLIWWDLIGFPRLVYPTPCLPLNFWVVLLLLYLVLGLILHYDHVLVILLF